MKQVVIIPLVLVVLRANAVPVDHRIECPREVSKETLEVKQAPKGWTGFVPFEYEPALPLNDAGLMWGPPSSMTISKPPWIGRIKGRDAMRWPDLEGKESGEKWMACFYGDNGHRDVILSTRLDDNATECTVTYPKKRGGTIDILCKW